jgi:hypothetical protein
MQVIHEKLIDCTSMTPAECSDACLAALQHGSDFALKANAPTDTVHGTVSIVHNDPPEAHIITVNVYDADEAPTAQMVHGTMQGRQSTLKRPDPMPTEQVIKDRINAIRSN